MILHICRTAMEFCLIVLLGLFLRWAVSLYSYSGQNKPPLYGDYEAQRHWQEVTVNLDISDWYINTTDNDLLYWGLDYPPLTAYHSYIMGLLANLVDPNFISLHSSKGYESYEHKLFMRLTVLLVDLIIYIPAVWIYGKSLSNYKTSNRILVYAALLLYPGLYLIDYGHFQYNNFSLGLFIGAVALLSLKYHGLASVAFALSLNYKQMELYHSFPFFIYLLSYCLHQKNCKDKIVELVKISFAVAVTFILVWLPFIYSLKNFFQVLRRIFPFYRGLFEDKVASLWCTLSIFIKFKEIFSINNMALICLGSTSLFLMPTTIHLFLNPTIRHFRYSLINCSLIFFLFSFHVHEKNILLATTPACLVFNEEPFIVTWFFIISIVSMFPLFIKDGLLFPAISLLIFTYIIYVVSISSTMSRVSLIPVFADKSWRKYLNAFFVISICGCVCLIALLLFAPIVPSLPDLYSVLISTYSCAHFILFTLCFHYIQYTLKVKLH